MTDLALPGIATALAQKVLSDVVGSGIQQAIGDSSGLLTDLGIAIMGPIYERASKYRARRVGMLAGALRENLLPPAPSASHATPEIINPCDKVSVATTAETLSALTSDEPAPKDNYIHVLSNRLNKRGIEHLIDELGCTAAVLNEQGFTEEEIRNSKVGTTPDSADYLSQWRESASTLEREDLKEIWARLLAGEIRNPGTASARTLSVLRNLSTEEGGIFQRYAPFIVGKTLTAQKDPHDVDINYAEIMLLDEAGLLNSDWVITSDPGIPSNRPFTILSPYGLSYQLELKFAACDKPEQISSITGYVLTKAGAELCNTALDFEPDNSHLKHILGVFKANHPIIQPQIRATVYRRSQKDTSMPNLGQIILQEG